ncbi:PP2C family protein-serine/threonine phosphatase [Methyloglobulus sp.]|uniref:PP2C family protein-serine/threonine phosphatase n=1 Tax=Methyloglobulus sp. TaxID=2518622 RepID=UPI003989211C
MTKAGWESYGVTHTGKIRKINQDAFLELTDSQLWLVADGMGGHKDGEYASGAIVDALKKFAPNKTIGATISWIHRKLQSVNQALCHLESEGGGQEIIGSTAAILLGYQQYCISLWSGDSRIYLFRNGKLKQITHDHNYGAYLATNGFGLDEASAHPYSQFLTHAIGSDKEFFLEAQIQEIRPNDIFLLCSDGLNKEIADTEIEAILQATAIKEATGQLMDLSLLRGARDNVTIVLAHCIGG